MNKRDVMLSLLEPDKTLPYIPAAFFLHFAPEFHFGQAAVDKHLEFFRTTGMDFVKIQFEQRFPALSELRRPEDWARIPLYKTDFFEAQLGVVEGLVKAAKSEALVIMTLYSPFMLANQMTSPELVMEHVRANPEAFKKGLAIITESLLNFVRGCIKLGIDGFYASTQGGEVHRLGGMPLFEQVVKPSDLAIWKVIQPACIFNILHVCDYEGIYADYQPYLDYPGQVVSCSLKLKDRQLTGQEVEEMFQRPFMGGMERLGVIAHGTLEEIRRAAWDAISAGPNRLILGADCTVPSDTPWDHLRAAIETAHQWRKQKA